MSDSKIKVLHLISSGGLYGAERVILNIARNKTGLDSYIGAIYNQHNPHIEIIDEAKNMSLKTVLFNSKGQLDIRTVFAIKHFLNTNNIDVIHTHNYKSDILGILAAKLANIKCVATNHTWHSSDKKMRFYERIDAFFLKFCEKVVAVSDEIKEVLIKSKVDQSKVKVIYNGIDIDRFSEERPKNALKSSFGFSDDDIIVSIIARLSKEKGHEILLKAAQEVIKTNHNIKFLVVGDGPLKEILKQMAEKYKLMDAVYFTGVRFDMPDIYSNSDIFVNTSYVEGLPMSILEAMAAKVPMIVTPVGAATKIIKNQENGILVDAGDYLLLAKEIERLSKDPNKRKSLAEHAYTDVCQLYSDVIMVNSYRDVYQKALK